MSIWKFLVLFMVVSFVASFVPSRPTVLSSRLMRYERGATLTNKVSTDSLEIKSIPCLVDTVPKRWRVSNIKVALDLDTGKDDTTVHDALIDSLAAAVDVSPKKLTACDLLVVKKSYDGRRRKSIPPGFTYIIDITEGLNSPLEIKEKSSNVERLRAGKSGDECDVSKRLAKFASITQESVTATDSNIVIVGAGPAGTVVTTESECIILNLTANSPFNFAGLFSALALVKAGLRPTIIGNSIHFKAVVRAQLMRM